MPAAFIGDELLNATFQLRVRRGLVPILHGATVAVGVGKATVPGDRHLRVVSCEIRWALSLEPMRLLQTVLLRILAVMSGLFCLCSDPPAVLAHTPSETYLTLTLSRTNLTGQWDVALRDLEQGLAQPGLDTKALSSEDLARRQEALALDTVARLSLHVDDSPVEIQFT